MRRRDAVELLMPILVAYAKAYGQPKWSGSLLMARLSAIRERSQGPSFPAKPRRPAAAVATRSIGGRPSR
jgi:hypothetical protein